MTGSGPRALFTIEPLEDTGAAEVDDFYRRILVPNFPAGELDSAETIRNGLRTGEVRAMAARAADGSLAGGAVGQWFGHSRVMLLSYLAVTAESRGTGIGSLLLSAASEAWTASLDPRYLVAEVEDPRYFGDAGFGDPVARVRFYERAGARAVPLPYFQPALGPGRCRVEHLMLMVLPGGAAPPGTRLVDGQVIESFLAEYFRSSEEPPREDDALARLLAACRRPGGLPLLRVSELPEPAGQ